MGAKTLGGGEGGGSRKLSRVMRGENKGEIRFKRGIGDVSPSLVPNPPTPPPIPR